MATDWSPLLAGADWLALNATVPPVESCALETGLGATLLSCYGGCAILVSVLLSRMVWRDRRLSVPAVFLLLTGLFLLVRLAWLVLHAFALGDPVNCHSPVTFVLNRLAFILYFCGLSLLLFFWAQQYHRTVLDDPVFSFLPSVRWWFVALNATMVVYQLVVCIVWFATGQAKAGDVLYDSNVLVDMTVVSLLALVFSFYGIRLWRQSREGGDTSQWRVQEGRLFLFGSLLMLIPFIARVIMFSWRFIHPDAPLPNTVFYAFAYAIPELLPLAIQLYVTRERKKAVTEGQAYIDNLYANSNSDHIASFLLQADEEAANKEASSVGVKEKDESLVSPIQDVKATKPSLDSSTDY